MLAQQGIQIYTLGTALLGSLILGKVVLLVDKLSLSRKMDEHPKIYSVLFRSFIYLTGYILFVLLEHFVKGLVLGEGLAHSFSHAMHYLTGKDFIISLLVVLIVFIFFNTFWVLRNHFGPGKLFNLFFRKGE